MKTPTKNSRYNCLLVKWTADTGKVHLPQCENCDCDMTGQDVREIPSMGWFCTVCASEEDCDAHSEQERPSHWSDMNYAGGGYNRDSSGNYSEAFYAGTP
jgi:hypothetical protein